MHIYEEWGFLRSPFQTTALPPNSLGNELLVGREEEIGRVMRRISSAPKAVTIEGMNGVGKTSLVNVASYRLLTRGIEADAPLFIPCRRSFQLSPTADLKGFVQSVIIELAQTLIERSDLFEAKGISTRIGDLDNWMNKAQLSTFTLGIMSLSGGMSTSINTSPGFVDSGFRRVVLECVQTAFPESEGGGIICTIDNLELLRTSDAARAQLEGLRDELLTAPGLRWVLCGALGIVAGVVTSPRLDGLLHSPVEVKGVGSAVAGEVFRSRLHAYSAHESPYLPLLLEDFERLNELLKRNLRSVLGLSDSYCLWVSDGSRPETDDGKRACFNSWLELECSDAQKSVKGILGTRAWKLFEDAAEFGGLFSSSDYDTFGFNSSAAMRSHVKDLEDAGVVVSTHDEGDRRRKTIQITPKGWLLRYSHGQTSNVEQS